MSEESERADPGSEGSGAGTDPVAMTLALGAANREEANAFLRKQARLADLQAKELAHELELRHWSMLVRHLSGLLKLTLEVGLAVAAVALACFLGAAVWNAAHADGLVAPPDAQVDKGQRMIVNLLARGELGQYQAVIASAPEVEQAARSLGESFIVRDIFELQLHPMLALARAKTGDLAGARALIGASPLDCYDCVRIRGLIAEEAGQPAQADQWFARAIHDAPSIPRAYANWGTALLRRSQPDAAMEKFKLANQKGPHFADPLEGWGEALMAKNQSHLAVAKFAEAAKYAPNWGRLHLKWGEALYYRGRKDEARKQFARAATLDLTTSERRELSGATHG